MKKPLLIAVAALALSASPAVHAQTNKAPAAAPAEPTPEELALIQRAAVILRTFNIAFESKDVQQAVKGQLLRCMYNNKLSDIAAATNRVLDSNPNLKPSEPGTIYRAAAGVCGITFQPAGSPPPKSGAVPVKPSTDSR